MVVGYVTVVLQIYVQVQKYPTNKKLISNPNNICCKTAGKSDIKSNIQIANRRSGTRISGRAYVLERVRYPGPKNSLRGCGRIREVVPLLLSFPHDLCARLYVGTCACGTVHSGTGVLYLVHVWMHMQCTSRLIVLRTFGTVSVVSI